MKISMAAKILAIILALLMSTETMASKRTADRNEDESEPEPALKKTTTLYPLVQWAGFSPHSKNTHITKLDLSDDWTLTNIDFIYFFSHLIELDLSNCINLKNNYSPISQLTNLQRLDLGKVYLTITKHLRPLTNLNFLNIFLPNIKRGLKYISRLPNLETFMLEGFNNKGLNKISRMTSLKKLILYGFSLEPDHECYEKFPDLDFITPLTNLKELSLPHIRDIINIKPICNLPNLTNLNLSGCYNIEDLSLLSNVTSLVKLDLRFIELQHIENDLLLLTILKNLRLLKINHGYRSKFPNYVKVIN